MSTDVQRLHLAKLAHNTAHELCALREALKRVNARGAAEAPLVLAELITERAERLALISLREVGHA